MKRLLTTGLMLAAGLAVSAAAPAPAAAQTAAAKIGYINSQRILAEAPTAVQARQQIERELAPAVDSLQPVETQLEQLQTELETMLAEGQRYSQDLERQRSTLTADARTQREQELQQRREAFAAKQAEYQQILMGYQERRTTVQQRAQQREEELMAPVMRRISEVLEQVRTEGDFAVIFDVAGGTMLVAADPSLDLSDQVLARLRTPAGQ